MSELMKGNFEPKKKVVVELPERDLEAEFERTALKRLGGSIAFVSKKQLLWVGDQKSPEKPS